jgi:ribosomal protein S12 methylthiotransferase accessory factor
MLSKQSSGMVGEGVGAAKAVRMSSSLRSRGLAESLVIAKKLAIEMGVTRVTDSTPLDRIGIPVFSSVRPSGVEGSLCVNAGKGARPDEARMGAYMEAIEYAYAEHGASEVEAFDSTVGEMLKSWGPGVSFEDFAPLMGRTASDEDLIEVVKAELVGTGRSVLAPAELVFLPYRGTKGEVKFGCGTSCGLASGNTVEEASVHALAEIIEHDVGAFESFKQNSLLVDNAQLTGVAGELKDKMEAAGFYVYLRYADNGFGVPYFKATVVDHSENAAVNVCAGFGSHPIKEIAAIRALTEAAQSRLTVIHGGRDDLTKYPDTWAKHGADARANAIAQARVLEGNSEARVEDYGALPDFEGAIDSIESAWAALWSACEKTAGCPGVARVVFTPPGCEMAVVKLIAPRLEAFDYDVARFGPRLRAFVNGL